MSGKAVPSLDRSNLVARHYFPRAVKQGGVGLKVHLKAVARPKSKSSVALTT